MRVNSFTVHLTCKCVSGRFCYLLVQQPANDAYVMPESRSGQMLPLELICILPHPKRTQHIGGTSELHFKMNDQSYFSAYAK